MYFGALSQGKKVTKFSQPKILEEWEDLNVDIPSKRKRMREYFVEILKEQNKGFLEKNNLYQEECESVNSTEMERMKTRENFYTKEQYDKYR